VHHRKSITLSKFTVAYNESLTYPSSEVICSIISQ